MQAFEAPRISPDGERVVMTYSGAAGGDVWLFDIGAQTSRRLTTTGRARYPLWSPDGTRVIYNEQSILMSQPADGSGEPETLLRDTGAVFAAAESWTPDGSALVFRTSDNSNDLLTLGADGVITPLVVTEFEATAATLSADGRWLAYVSDRSGRREVYVRPFPGPGGETIVSIGGGNEPAWGPAGGSLYYRSGTHLVEVTVSTDPDFRIVGRQELFDISPYFSPSITRRHYDPHPDGERFLMIRTLGGAEAQPRLEVVLNWFEDLKQRVPTGQ